MLIKSTACITRSRLKALRGIAAAAIGSLFSLIIFLPRVSPIGLTAVKLLSAAPVVWVAFGYESKGTYLKRLFIFFLASFIFAGIGSAASGILGGRLIISRNGVIYGNFSMPVLIAATIGAYAVIYVYKRAADVSEKGGIYTVTARHGNRIVSFRAMADTGNSLRDMITGRPVIVVSREVLEKLFDNVPTEQELWDVSEKSPPGNTAFGNTAAAVKWRLIPCKTISGTALIPICRPDEAAVKNEETGRIHTADVYLGASPCECEFALFDPGIL